ncbi:MAG: hypothetical protein ACTSXU_04510 [Promethearchaeota archaeon]
MHVPVAALGTVVGQVLGDKIPGFFTTPPRYDDCYSPTIELHFYSLLLIG